MLMFLLSKLCWPIPIWMQWPLFPKRFQSLADDFLIGTHSVSLCGIEIGNATFVSGTKQINHLLFVVLRSFPYNPLRWLKLPMSLIFAYVWTNLFCHFWKHFLKRKHNLLVTALPYSPLQPDLKTLVGQNLIYSLCIYLNYNAGCSFNCAWHHWNLY